MISLEDRMKQNYEDRYRIKLIRRIPVILRLDGKAFHTYTKHCLKPCDPELMRTFQETACALLAEIQGAKIVYTQSDEISLLLTDFDTLETDAWFDYNLQKMVSVAASMCTFHFNSYRCGCGLALFDCRAFNIPREEVCNYFVCRQQDCTRNAISATAQSIFSHKKLQGKSCKEMLVMLEKEKGTEFYVTEIPEAFRFGTWYFRGTECISSPRHDNFKDKRELVECFLTNN